MFSSILRSSSPLFTVNTVSSWTFSPLLIRWVENDTVFMFLTLVLSKTAYHSLTSMLHKWGQRYVWITCTRSHRQGEHHATPLKQSPKGNPRGPSSLCYNFLSKCYISSAMINLAALTCSCPFWFYLFCLLECLTTSASGLSAMFSLSWFFLNSFFLFFFKFVSITFQPYWWCLHYCLF